MFICTNYNPVQPLVLYNNAMAIYESYADIYDAIGQGAFAEQQANALLAALGNLPRRVLDLACGTGAAARVFAAAGSEVIGIDRSASMLSLARARARDAGLPITFVQADLRDWAAWSTEGAQIDLIVCYYNSLNYLLDDGDLEQVFRGCAVFLRPGGLFVFDINSPAEYATWDGAYQVLHDDQHYLVYQQLIYDPFIQRGEGRIVWFTREIERWWRGEEVHMQRAWRAEEVQAGLAAAGLHLVQATTLAGTAVETTTRQIIYQAKPLS
jgi:SAM-dependent methyltransferase